MASKTLYSQLPTYLKNYNTWKLFTGPTYTLERVRLLFQMYLALDNPQNQTLSMVLISISHNFGLKTPQEKNSNSVENHSSKCLSPKSTLQKNQPTGRVFLKRKEGDFPGCPEVKNPPSNAVDTGSISGRGTKIPQAAGQLSLSTTTREKPAHCKS